VSPRRKKEPTRRQVRGGGRACAVLEEGERREDGERDEVPEDAEDDAVDPDVERLLGDDVVPGIDELHAHHHGVRSPPLAVPLPRRHPPPIPISPRLRWAVAVPNFSSFLVCGCAWLLLGLFSWSSGLRIYRSGPLTFQIFGLTPVRWAVLLCGLAYAFARTFFILGVGRVDNLSLTISLTYNFFCEKIVNTHGNSKFNADLRAYTTAANSDWVKDQSSLSFVARAPEMTIRIAPKKYEYAVSDKLEGYFTKIGA